MDSKEGLLMTPFLDEQFHDNLVLLFSPLSLLLLEQLHHYYRTFEFTIQSNNFGKNIYPTNSGPTSTYLNNGNKDEIYLDILVTVRNLSSTELSESDDFMDIKIICDEREELNSFTSFERKSYEDVQENKFSISNNSIIEPSQTRVVHFLTSVPTSVEKDGKPLKAIITANGENYEYIIR